MESNQGRLFRYENISQFNQEENILVTEYEYIDFAVCNGQWKAGKNSDREDQKDSLEKISQNSIAKTDLHSS